MPTSTPPARRPITGEERRRFAEQGWLMLPRAVPAPLLRRLLTAVDRVYAEEALAGRVRPDRSLHLLGFLPRHPAFLELLDLPTTLRYAWGLLGWNLHVHHCHLDVNPPVTDPGAPVWAWHQDGGRQNLELETSPRPMLSVKLAYLLTDLSETGRGNTRIIPGSHRRDTLARPRPELGHEEPRGAIQVTGRAGDAFVFDRRLWHSRSVNTSGITRKLLFLAYTYRWVRPRDDMEIDRDSDLWRRLTPVRRQLLGDGPDAMSHWGLGTDAVPLREELRRKGLLDPTVPQLR
ncbi:MAG TPA: phytanoyl-CoA dioxygenase family protein [Actinomycetota bacterium]|nr:phytanoyl-CoA dioxygenase family protein [Actinomycetota bacterium]